MRFEKDPPCAIDDWRCFWRVAVYASMSSARVWSGIGGWWISCFDEKTKPRMNEKDKQKPNERYVNKGTRPSSPGNGHDCCQSLFLFHFLPWGGSKSIQAFTNGWKQKKKKHDGYVLSEPEIEHLIGWQAMWRSLLWRLLSVLWGGSRQWVWLSFEE